jgi:hypothetical protein
MDWIQVVDVEAGETHRADPEMAGARTVLVRLPRSAAADAFIFIPGTDVFALRTSGDTTGEGLLRLRHVPIVNVPSLGLGRSANPEAVVFYEVSLSDADSLANLESARP